MGEIELASEYAHRLSVARLATRWYPVARPDDPYVTPAAPPLLSAPKLRHDVEQLRYLQERGVLGSELSPFIAEYERVLADVAARGDLQEASRRSPGVITAR